MRNGFAAIAALMVYFAGSFFVGFGIVRVVAIALLLANARGTWLSQEWRSDQTEPPPAPMQETLGDRIADRFPIWVWPYAKYPYYVLAALEFGLVLVGLANLLRMRLLGS